MIELRRILKRNSFLSYGVPFLVTLVGGSFALQQYAQLRYTFRKNRLETQAGGLELLSKMKPATTVEEEYERVQKLDIDNWMNVRGPRPWEDSKSVQAAARQSTSNKS